MSAAEIAAGFMMKLGEQPNAGHAAADLGDGKPSYQTEGILRGLQKMGLVEESDFDGLWRITQAGLDWMEAAS